MLSTILSSRTRKSLSDYVFLSKEIDRVTVKQNIDPKKILRIAIVSSFTTTGIKETLQVICAEADIFTQFYIAGYNQYAQEILEVDSGLYGFDPDLVIVFVDTMTISGDYYFLPYLWSADERKAWATDQVRHLTTLAQTITERSRAKVILHNFETPSYSPLGILENKQEAGFIESVETVNSSIRDHFKNHRQIFVFDYDAFCSQIGKDNLTDHKMYYLGDIKLKPALFPALCHRYLGYVRAMASLTRKCIVLDLDNTLWGGVVGEVGFEHIALGPTPSGRPFLEFQKHLLSLFHRGVILAVNSRNNPEDALKVLRSHPNMVLKEHHFAAMRINWKDKVTNMGSLAREINVGLASIVFIDDDEVNRDMMKQLLPEVLVVDLPTDPALYVSRLASLNVFDGMWLTMEDTKRGQAYAEEKNRRELAKNTISVNDYLRQLKIAVMFEDAHDATIPRIAQLTQRTNQFTLTTRRYSQEAISKLLRHERYRVITAHVSDKFGDNGLTGVAIVERSAPGEWRIDTFLLSCRIIGRRVEEALLAHVMQEAKDEGAEFVRGEYVETKSNKLTEGFYEKCGFRKQHVDNVSTMWVFDLEEEFAFPDVVNISQAR